MAVDPAKMSMIETKLDLRLYAFNASHENLPSHEDISKLPTSTWDVRRLFF